jgi:hypothetical protein
MKKVFINTLVALTIMSSLSSCATLFGGKVTQAQRTAPKAGEPSRSVRPVALIADILLFWPSLVVDFATGAIYKPEANTATAEKEATTAKQENAKGQAVPATNK